MNKINPDKKKAKKAAKYSPDTYAIINALGIEVAVIALQLELAAQRSRGEPENLEKAAFRFFELTEFIRNYGGGKEPPPGFFT